MKIPLSDTLTWAEKLLLRKETLRFRNSFISSLGKKPRLWTATMEEERRGRQDYALWSQEKLIQRVTQLEKELRATTVNLQAAQGKRSISPHGLKKEKRENRPFDPSIYSTRLIALKLAYLGKNYNGFEHHPGNKTPLPTIEEELWKALHKAKLIFPAGDQGVGDWEGTEYSKCGRTDKGVSAFGQVIGVRVRSNRPLPKKAQPLLEEPENHEFDTYPRPNGLELASPPIGRIDDPNPEPQSSTIVPLDDPDFREALNFDHIKDELPYAMILNRLLPPEIRILAWCPSPPIDFSARFSCRERQYRYFFTQPAFLPIPNQIDAFHAEKSKEGVKDGWLDIEAMREAAKYFEGAHDFRNFCKVDASKQITNFERRIFKADIEEVPKSSLPLGFLETEDFQVGQRQESKVYTFTLHGSAFLWHQVRCMVSILFLVAQGLEKPSIVKELLDVETNPTRPLYEMASDTPLVLWDCVFPNELDPERKDAMEWLYVGDEPGHINGKYSFGAGNLMDDMWRVWREKQVDEVLAASLMQLVAGQGKGVKELSMRNDGRGRSQKLFDGSKRAKLVGAYVPIMQMQRGERVEIVNERYAIRKGFGGTEEMRRLGYKRVGGKNEE